MRLDTWTMQGEYLRPKITKWQLSSKLHTFELELIVIHEV